MARVVESLGSPSQSASPGMWSHSLAVTTQEETELAAAASQQTSTLSSPSSLPPSLPPLGPLSPVVPSLLILVLSKMGQGSVRKSEGAGSREKTLILHFLLHSKRVAELNISYYVDLIFLIFISD